MINNRQAGRRRGRGNNGGGGNGPRQGGGGRGDNGNRIDSRARGNAAQLLEKYKNLASDAQRQGDRVNTEYYLQFADHYFRVLADQKGRFEDQQPRRQQNDFDDDGDDYGAEGEPIRVGDQGEVRAERQDRQNERSFDRQRGERPERGDRPRRWERDDRPRAAEGEPEVAGQHRADPPVAGEDLDARAETVLEADAPLADPAPRRRGRPRREPAAEVETGGVDADRLPPALGISAANDADGEEEAPKPRRRRVRTAAPNEA